MRWAQGIKDEEDSASPWGVPGVTEETDTEQRTTVIEYEECSSADVHGPRRGSEQGHGVPRGRGGEWSETAPREVAPRRFKLPQS